MPKVEQKRIDGVSYNVDHARKIGKDAFVVSPEFAAHYPDVPEAERRKALAAVYDQLVQPAQSISAGPGPAKS